MSKPSDICIRDVRHTLERVAYRTPMKFGGRVVTDALLLHVHIDVETRDGRRATGLGSMPLSNAWAWPSQRQSGEQTLAAMTRLAERVADVTRACRATGHPLELAHDLAPQWHALCGDVEREQALAEPIPPLALLVAASPFDAALHDAFGQALGANAYNLLGPEFVNRDLGQFLSADFAGEFLDRYTLRQPKPSMPLYHLVGALDPLSAADVSQPVGDGLPETLAEWIAADQLTHLKIKLNGDQLDWDVHRVAAVEQVAAPVQQQRGCAAWHYSLDFNERCANVEYVLEFLARLRQQAPQALERVQYIEQPTHRDLRAHPHNRMHRAAQIKPVVIDESLVDFASLLLSRELGYSGVALKACKGHTEALLMGAAAQKYGMFLCVQDLTCPGASFLHSASLAARIPTVAAIEGNSRQYCPAGNRGWAERYPGMFRVQHGTVATGLLTEHGLGYSAPS